MLTRSIITFIKHINNSLITTHFLFVFFSSISLFPCFLSGSQSFFTFLLLRILFCCADCCPFLVAYYFVHSARFPIFSNTLSLPTSPQSVNMPVPTYNAKPLSMMLLGARVLQAICMILVIGICSNFVQMIVTTGVEPPKEFVGTLSVVRIFKAQLQHNSDSSRLASQPSTSWSAWVTTGRKPTSAFS